MSDNLDESNLAEGVSRDYESLEEPDRALLVRAIVDQLIAVGVVASAAPDGPDAARLRQLADSFDTLALGGSFQQQLCCDLAIELSGRTDAATALLSIIFPPLTNAVKLICRLGSRIARDSAVNALGAMLRSSSDPEALLPSEVAVRTDEGDPAVNEMYEEQWRHTRLAVLAIAGSPGARNAYLAALEKQHCVTTQEFHENAELLCALPAFLKATPREPDLDARVADLLTHAIAQHTDLRSGSAEEIACARHQEVLLETIASVVDLGVPAESFDLALAKALDSTPMTLLGSTATCNAHVRTAIALIDAAAAILLRVHEGATSHAFRALVESLADRSQWINPGIVEGCYQVLPSLLSEGARKSVVAPVVSRLVVDLTRPVAVNDFEGVHRKLIATECFRRLLRMAARNSRKDVFAILAHPTIEQIRGLFASGAPQAAASPRGVATTIIEAWALEAAWLRESAALFEHWEEWDLARRLLAVRTLAMEVRACDESRHASRNAELRQAFASLAFAGVNSESRLKQLWLLLASLPAEAAQAADADLHDFFESFGDVRDADQLPGFVLSMVSSSVSSGIADAIARRIELSHRRQLRRNVHVDLARLLYPLMLRDPDTSIFDHLLPRLAADDDRAVVLFFRRLTDDVRTAAAGQKAHDRTFRVDDLVYELSPTKSAVLARLRTTLDLYRQLTKLQWSIWETLRNGPRGGLYELFYGLDDLADGQRPSLAQRHATRAVQLQNDVAQYLDLPVQRFDARASALRRAAEVVRHIEADLDRSKSPENSLLLMLLHGLRDLFEQTIRWYCEQPKQLREAGKPDEFWHLFVQSESAVVDKSLLVAGDVSGALDSMFRGIESQHQVDYAFLVNGDPPPYYDGQHGRFERYCVEWMSADFETERLSQALRPRWSWLFRAAYACLTNQWLLAAIVLSPFVTAAVLHRVALHSLEGLGFLAMTSATVLVLLVAAFPAPRFRSQPQYRFECMYPRMAGLILAPMILTIEFEHSYEFPVQASSTVILLLLALSFLGTRFVVVRAVGDRRRARKVVAVAIAHAFGIAVLLSWLFCGHVHEKDLHTKSFLHVPRAVTVDLNEVAARMGRSLPALEPVVFYPTIIAMWLAFGLFVGVVIEGSLKEKGEKA